MKKRIYTIILLSFLTSILFGQTNENNSKSNICQPFIVQLNQTLTSHPIIDTFYFHVCPNDSVTFAAEAVFLDTNGV